MVELVDGPLEVLTRLTWLHQLTVDFFLDAIKGHMKANHLGGRDLFCSAPGATLSENHFEPDIFYIVSDNLPKLGVEYSDCLDFISEVVGKGPDARRRDYEATTNINRSSASKPAYRNTGS